MPLGGLQHYTIEPQDLERTKNFYCDVLGLENGDRPPLDFPGYWLYSGGIATVHLMGTRKPREGIVVRGKLFQRGVPRSFVAPVPLYAGGAGAHPTLLGVVIAAGPETAFYFTTPAAPSKIVIDPHMTLLCVSE